jgi:ATP-dependent protease HslVU (ClpYQ) peptidase subunit
MTCIAYKDGVMAAESRVMLDEGIVATEDIKIHRMRGHLIGASGASNQCADFLKWFKAGSIGKAPPITDCHILIVTPDGMAHLWDEQQTLHITHPAAIGCGSRYAIGAMSAGATAKKAVDIACQFDPNCGGKIRTLRL